jgi:Histidine kinase-, DNA gyrase B-, and HSP90-like ATPase
VTLADLAMAERQRNAARLEQLRALRAERFELMDRLAQLPSDIIDPALSIDADPQLLTSAVMNLLHNAFKNALSGGHVVLRARGEHATLHIEIEDECGGIPQSKGDLLQVFGDRRGSDRSGLGLGLSIARKAVRAHGGEIRIRNMPGKGCVFTIEVPLAAEEPFPKRCYSPEYHTFGHDGLPVAIVISAEGAILERVLETAHSISSEGLSRQEYAQFDAAQMRTAWGRRSQRRCAGGRWRRARQRHAVRP